MEDIPEDDSELVDEPEEDQANMEEILEDDSEFLDEPEEDQANDIAEDGTNHNDSSEDDTDTGSIVTNKNIITEVMT